MKYTSNTKIIKPKKGQNSYASPNPCLEYTYTAFIDVNEPFSPNKCNHSLAIYGSFTSTIILHICTIQKVQKKELTLVISYFH